jgi:hypothetical protein
LSNETSYLKIPLSLSEAAVQRIGKDVRDVKYEYVFLSAGTLGGVTSTTNEKCEISDVNPAAETTHTYAKYVAP